MDSNTEIPRGKRGLPFLAAAIVMLILGETLLRHSLGPIPFVIYWMACLIFTALAILFSLRDVFGVQRQARAQQRELLEKTIGDIARQKDAKARGQSGQ